MIQELTAYKPSTENATNILPPMMNNDTSSISFSSDNSRLEQQQQQQQDVTTIDIEHRLELEQQEDSEIQSKVASIEPWFVSRKEVPLCKTIRELLRVASGSQDDSSQYSSACSSLTFSDETTIACSNEWNKQNDKDTIDGHEGSMQDMSDDSTVACGNKGKLKCNTCIGSEITMDTTDSDDSLERGNHGMNGKTRKTNQSLLMDTHILSSLGRCSRKITRRQHRSVSIMIPTISNERWTTYQNETCSRDSSDSSLTVSDEDSQFGMLDGREEI